MSWFESVAEAQRRAKRRLPAPVYAALVAGSEHGVTTAGNVAAFDEFGFAPHVVGLPAERRQGATVMGQAIALPVILSPVGVQAVHPDGEVAVARAAAARGTAMGLSEFASRPLTEVVAVHPQVFFQTHWSDRREELLQRAQAAREQGAVGLILTLDWSFSHGRDWGSPRLPERLGARELLRLAPAALSRPGWLYDYARAGRRPDLRVPNRSGNPTFFAAYTDWSQVTPPTWSDLAWIGERFDGPLMIKGISRVDDARRAVDVGATAISVSNHGGNNLDTTPAALRSLPSIAAAVGDQIEVLLDGGVRRGSDVVKALALGARAVMIGRAYLWGLAADGQAGVENVLDILRGGIDSTLLGLGHSSIDQLSPEDLVPLSRLRRPSSG